MNDRVESERDFFREMAILLGRGDPEVLVRDGLAALVRVTAAREGMLELFDDSRGVSVGWNAREGCDAARADAIRAMTSRGILGEALASGKTVLTASALQDPRFADLESVRAHAIEAVLCAPIGRDAPVGFVYLQGTNGSSTFGAAERACVEFFADALGHCAHGMIARALDGPRTLGPGLEGVIGSSEAMMRVADKVRAVAPLEVQVLLIGPSGAGKTQLGRLLHASSPRRTSPFVELNCAAIPDALLESELFGAERGAHSTALKEIPGKVSAAEGGTLFLDEVGELSLAAQAKLLQLLQDKEYFPLGSTKRRVADVRLIAATNRDLRELVARGAFRADLFYRLRVLEISIPPLSSRTEDVLPLAEHFLALAVARHQLRARHLSPGARRSLLLRDWPGNVRELAHVVESAAIHASIRASDFVEATDIESGGSAASDDGTETLHGATRAFQRRFVEATLNAHDWNVSEVARRLDLARSHVYNLIRSFGLARSETRS